VGSSFREQLSGLPVPRLTNVVRVNLDLSDEPYAFDNTAQIILNWWNSKARPYDVSIDPQLPALSFSQSGFKIEFARAGGTFALAMEEPDSSVPGRTWIVDVGLREIRGRSEFGFRASYRQPQNSTSSPEPRAPRFLRDILEEVGATDVWDLKSTVQTVDLEAADILIEFIESPRRRLPVIVVSEEPQTGAVFTDPEKLTRLLAGTAHVILVDRFASWELSKRWGDEWSVFRGAVRCYNPGFDRGGDKFKHRLWRSEFIQRLDANSRNGFTNAVVANVFTQLSAQFETMPLLTPAMVRREIEDASRVSPSEALEAVPTPPIAAEFDAAKIASIDRTAIDKDRELVSARDQVQELRELNAELIARLEKQEERSLKLEADLQEERSARASTESSLAEANNLAEMFEKENVHLEQQQSVAFGDINKEPSAALRPMWENFHGLFGAMENVAIKFRRMEIDSDKIDNLERMLAEANQELLDRNATIDSLNRRKPSQNGGELATAALFRAELEEIVPRIVKGNGSVATMLNIAAITFPDRLTVLESAFNSAKESESFVHVQKAFDLIWCLGTEYWQIIRTKGDVEARKVFGKGTFAPNEGDNLSKAALKRRTFDYAGEALLMLKHLKIGNAHNDYQTLRIHFEWVARDDRIVIGHCGKHLDF